MYFTPQAPGSTLGSSSCCIHLHSGSALSSCCPPSLPLPPNPTCSPPALYPSDLSPFPIHFLASINSRFAYPTLSNLGCFIWSHLCPERMLSFFTRFALIQISLLHIQFLTAKISSYNIDLSNQQSGCPPGCLQERYSRGSWGKEGLAEDLGFSPLYKAAENSSNKSGVQDPHRHC